MLQYESVNRKLNAPHVLLFFIKKSAFIDVTCIKDMIFNKWRLPNDEATYWKWLILSFDRT